MPFALCRVEGHLLVASDFDMAITSTRRRQPKMNNPKIAIDAILAAQEREVKNYKLYPITVGRYALLEAVESPLVDANSKFTMLNAIPSLYIVLNDIEQLKKYNTKNIEQLKADAMEWAEKDLDTNDLPDLVKTIIDMLLDINKATPSVGDQDKGKKANG